MYLAQRLLLTALLCAACSSTSSTPEAPETTASSTEPAKSDAAITLAVSPTNLVHGSGPVLAKLSSPVPATKGKRYRISLSTPDAATFSGPSQFLEPGATQHELRPVEAGTFDVRLLESDGPECDDGAAGPCARNERVIAKSEPITVTPKPE